ncbi:MAG: NmrA family NAD(P)-binding protein [Longimicrobiales bacterium]
MARELLAAGHRIRAMTRKPDSPAARALAVEGAEVVRGDLDDAGSLNNPLRVSGVLLRCRTRGRPVSSGKKSKASDSRSWRASPACSISSTPRSVLPISRQAFPHFENKFRVEETVRGLGFPSFAIIRPVFFMENLLGPWFKPAIDGGQLAMAIKPTTPLPMIAVADIGKCGRAVFERHAELNGRAIDIAGDELTMPDVAEIISEAAGHKVVHAPPPIETVRAASADYAVMLEWFDDVGYSADIASNAREFGIPPTRFRDWAREVSGN